MSDALVPVDPNSPEAKAAILGLLGTTLAELKDIDNRVVGSSKNIAGNRTNLQDVFKITDEQIPKAHPQQLSATVAPAVATASQPTAPTPVAGIDNTSEDPNQLIFDFNQKITPDTVNNKLDRILEKLDRVIDKLVKV